MQIVAHNVVIEGAYLIDADDERVMYDNAMGTESIFAVRHGGLHAENAAVLVNNWPTTHAGVTGIADAKTAMQTAIPRRGFHAVNDE